MLKFLFDESFGFNGWSLSLFVLSLELLLASSLWWFFHALLGHVSTRGGSLPRSLLIAGDGSVVVLAASFPPNTLNITLVLLDEHRPPIRRWRSSLDEVAESKMKKLNKMLMKTHSESPRNTLNVEHKLSSYDQSYRDSISRS